MSSTPEELEPMDTTPQEAPQEPMAQEEEMEVEVVPPPAKRARAETSGRTCQFCSSKKQVAAGCKNVACKKCCLAREGECSTHPKEVEKPERAEPAKPKKAVIKNEFRETNFHYYGETVTIFCVKDFFENKKLSQGVLNDQGRAERVGGKDWGRRKKKNAANPQLKELIQCALGKKPAPAGYGDVLGAVANALPAAAAAAAVAADA